MNRIYIAAMIVIVAIGFVGCKPPQKKVAEEENEETVFAVDTIQAVQGQIFDYIEVNGDVKASSSVDVFPDTAGKVSEINVRIGQRVKVDQPLLQVDPSRPGMNFASSPVKSPISGTVTSLPAEVGAVAAPSIPVATISRMQRLEIVTYLSERFISKAALGQDAIIELEAYPDVRFHGRISQLSPVLDPISRTMELKISIKEQDKRIKAGMFARIKLIVEEKTNIVKIPSEALVSRFGRSYVFVVNGELVEQRNVVPGIKIDNKLEIVEGLKPEEQIVVRGQSLLEDQAKVKIIKELAPLESADVIE